MSQKPKNRWALTGTRVLLLSPVLALVIIIAQAAFPPIRLLALLVVGRAPQCSASETARSYRNTEHQSDLEGNIKQASRKLRRESPGYALWETPRGSYWIPERDEAFLPVTLAEQQRGLYHRGEFGVRLGDVVLDCGAHIGTYTREALRAGARLVVAIEPAPDNLECLRRNLADEMAEGRVIVYPKGVWDHDDFLMLRMAGLDSAGDSVAAKYPGSREGPMVPLTTIDKLVAELHLERVDFIKMDIEGAERNAITGARQTIARHKPRMVIAAEHLKDDPVAIPAAVQGVWSGYKMESGPCVDAGLFVRPEVFFFHQ